MTQPVALVTGASRGIGRAIALTLANASFDVVVNFASSASAAEEVVHAIEAVGRRTIAVQANVAVASDRAKLLKASLDAFGRIDLLINNAGVASPGRKDLLEATEESFDQVIAANLKGPYFLSQAVARQMLAQAPLPDRPRGMIINISSISAFTASVNRGDYCLSKAAMSMMTALYADRLADEGILVYEIRPGIIATDMTAVVKEKYDHLIADGITPIRRWGLPDDVAKAVAMLAGGALPFSTGECIHVDGGFHLRRL